MRAICQTYVWQEFQGIVRKAFGFVKKKIITKKFNLP